MARKRLNALEMIGIWACEQHQGVEHALDIGDDPNGIVKNRGDLDPDEEIMRFVEDTPGFRIAKDALWWVFVLGNDPVDFRITKPGESLEHAVLIRGLDERLLDRPYQICRRMIDSFVGALTKRLKTQYPVTEAKPHLCPREEEEEMLNRMQANAEANRREEAERQRLIRRRYGGREMRGGQGPTETDAGRWGGYGSARKTEAAGHGGSRPRAGEFDHAAYLAGSLGTTLAEAKDSQLLAGAQGIAKEIVEQAVNEAKEA